MSRNHLLRNLVVGICAFLLATSAGAALFTVTLANGTTFETRYRPVIAEWDENYVMLRSDQGNWIAVPREEVVDVTSQAEATGFGYQLDTTTLYIGFTPGDIMTQLEEGEEAEAARAQGAAPPQPDTTPIQYGGSGTDYSLDQFLDIPLDGVIPSQPVDN